MRMGQGLAVEVKKEQPEKGVKSMGPRKEGFLDVAALGLVLEPLWLGLGLYPSTLICLGSAT